MSSANKKNVMEANCTYEVVRPVAKGTFGAVLLVRLIPRDFSSSGEAVVHTVAFKVQAVSPAVSGDCDIEYDTLRACHLVSIPHVIRVRGCVRLQDIPSDVAEAVGWSRGYMEQLKRGGSVFQITVLDRIPGTTLRHHLGSLANLHMCMSGDKVRETTRKLLEFAAGSYEKLGMEHGDLKLGNVLIGSPRSSTPTVIDMNLSKRGAPGPPGMGWHSGTLSYMSPEKLFLTEKPQGSTGGAQDAWSIGILMATMALTGVHIVEGEPDPFNPLVTDTVFQMLPMVGQLRGLRQQVANDAGVIEDVAEQAIRLCLWLQAVEGPKGFLLEEIPPRMSSIRCSALYQSMVKLKDEIVGAYDVHGHCVFEKTRDALATQLGEDGYGVFRALTRAFDRNRGYIHPCTMRGSIISPCREMMMLEFFKDARVHSEEPMEALQRVECFMPDHGVATLQEYINRLATTCTLCLKPGAKRKCRVCNEIMCGEECYGVHWRRMRHVQKTK